MPYKIYKKNGYKTCKPGGKKCFSKKGLSKEKARDQQKALYASESSPVEEAVGVKSVGSNLSFKSVYSDASNTEAYVVYKLKTEKSCDLTLVFSLGSSPEDTDYLYFTVLDHGDPKGKPKKAEDPHTEESASLLKTYGLTPDDIEMAGQDGYDRIVDGIFTKDSLSDPHEECLEFENIANDILNEDEKEPQV